MNPKKQPKSKNLKEKKGHPKWKFLILFSSHGLQSLYFSLLMSYTTVSTCCLHGEIRECGGKEITYQRPLLLLGAPQRNFPHLPLFPGVQPEEGQILWITGSWEVEQTAGILEEEKFELPLKGLIACEYEMREDILGKYMKSYHFPIAWTFLQSEKWRIFFNSQIGFLNTVTGWKHLGKMFRNS